MKTMNKESYGMTWDLSALGQELCDVYAHIPHRPFYLVDTAPEDYQTLRSLVSSSLPILAPFCDHTVFSDPSGNRVQRAVHDTVHLALDANTDEQGELRVAVEQSRLVGHYSTILADVTYADLRGQTLYFMRHKAFPVDQVGFTLHWLKTQDVEKEW